jgi:transposase-like protein
MWCPHCESTDTNERRERTALGYRRFRCHTCNREFNERTGTTFNHPQYPTDVVCLVVLWRVRYKLSLRDLPEMFLERGLVGFVATFHLRGVPLCCSANREVEGMWHD